MTGLWAAKTIQGAIRFALLSAAIPAIMITAGFATWLSLNFANEAADDLRTGIETVAKTRMAERANKKITDVLQVANSALLGTALLDTAGREVYLRPYLEERASSTGARYGVYDYRGRPVLQVSSGDTPALAPRADLVNITQTRLSLKDDTLFVENPIHAYDGAIIGYLVGRVPMLDFLIEAQVLPSRFFNVSAALRLDEPKDENGSSWFLLYEDGATKLYGTIEVEPGSTWFRQHISDTLKFSLIFFTAMIAFAVLLARALSSRLTRPLRQLTAAAGLFRNGRIARLPSSSMVELDALARALETTFQERRELEEQLKEAAAKDQLLQINNRAHFDTAAANILARLQPNEEASLLFIDLDRFKAVNDQYGHEAGDRVLQIAVDRIKSRIRQSDLVGRRGGDEFTLLLPTVDPATAMKIGRDLIRVLSEPMTVEYLGVVEIGASIGAAHYPQDADTLKGLMVAADTAMYQAKASGRGCVVNYKKAMTP